MSKVMLSFAAALSAAVSLLAAPAAAASPDRPVVVELFTAQGCSACVKAGPFADRLAAQPGVLPLTFSVDYWDYTGWSDTFAKPAFAARQHAYVKKLHLRDPYTPQMVVDGRAQASAVKHDEVEALIAQQARAKTPAPRMFMRADGRFGIGAGKAVRGGAEVWLVRYDPRLVEVEVKRGDNRGETVVNRNVVRELVRLGGWAGKPRSYAMPKETDGLAQVVLLQAAGGGRILAASPIR